MPHPPLPTRFLVSGLLVAAMHACVLFALLAPAALRPAPPSLVEVELVMEQRVGAPGPRPAQVVAAMPAPAQAKAVLPMPPAPAPRPASVTPPVAPASPGKPLPPALPTPSPVAPPPATAAPPAMSEGAGASGPAAAATAPGAVPAGEAGAITPPQLDSGNPSNPRPVYPAASRRLGEAGVVSMRLLVNPDGRVAEARLVRSSGYDRLDRAALQTVRRWTLRPARQGSEPIAAWLPYSIKFELEK